MLSTKSAETTLTTTLSDLTTPIHIIQDANGTISAVKGSQLNGHTPIASVPAVPLARLGDPTFLRDHGVKFAYKAGAMANGIASEALVIAMGKAGLIGSFGAAGLVPARVKSAIERIQTALPNGPYCFNLIHSPSEENLERSAVEMYLQYGVRTVEASAFLRLTPHIVRYRAAGLSMDENGEIVIGNRVIAKVSRREVATKFMAPAPVKMLNALVEKGFITPQQAQLAQHVPMADDVTVEADSGGHTDNRPLVCLLPSMIALRDDIQANYNYKQPIPHRRGGWHQHTRICARRIYDGCSVHRHGVCQSGVSRSGIVNAHQKAARTGGHGRRDYGTCGRYV